MVVNIFIEILYHKLPVAEGKKATYRPLNIPAGVSRGSVWPGAGSHWSAFRCPAPGQSPRVILLLMGSRFRGR